MFSVLTALLLAGAEPSSQAPTATVAADTATATTAATATTTATTAYATADATTTTAGDRSMAWVTRGMTWGAGAKVGG